MEVVVMMMMMMMKETGDADGAEQQVVSAE